MTDALAALLPTDADGDRPWLVWYSPGERIELTGHVLAMWQAKTAGLITSESGPAAQVHLALGPHWRAVTWCAGAWLAGSPVVLASGEVVDDAVASGQEAPAMSVAFEEEDLSQETDCQVLVPRASLATRWGGALPPLVLDGAADLMTHADRFPAPATRGEAPAVLFPEGVTYRLNGTLTRPERSLSRDTLVSRLPELSSASAPGRAVLVRERGTLAAAAGVLLAWSRGATAVLMSPEADDTLTRTAACQEGVSQG